MIDAENSGTSTDVRAVSDEPPAQSPAIPNEAAFRIASNARDLKSIGKLRGIFRARKKENIQLLPAEVEAGLAAVKLRNRTQDVFLKRLLASVVLFAVCAQLLVADAFLIHYSILSDRPPEASVLIAWLSASVVEVVGIVAIVARNLFPNRSRRRRAKK